MNISKFVVTATIIVSAGSALAESGYPTEAPFVSTKTRAEVVAELTQTGDQGRLNYANSTKQIQQATASTKTRADVQMELAAAYANHELDAIPHNGGH